MFESTYRTRGDAESQSSKKRHRLLWMLAVDLPLIGLVLTMIGLLERGAITNYKRGFYCNDPALSHKFTGDTVSNGLLMTVVFAFNLPVILITELLFVKGQNNFSKLTQAIKNMLWLHRSYIYSILLNVLIFEVMKSATGMPRPCFFDTCQPDAAKTCNGSEYLTTFTCTSNDADWIQSDSYRSFPSGHAALSVHLAIFVSWYLHRRAFNWRHRTTFVVPLLQMACLSLASVTAISRITDNKHHWWDVLVGVIHGSLCGLYNVYALCNNFTIRKPEEEDKLTARMTPLYVDRTRHF